MPYGRRYSTYRRRSGYTRRRGYRKRYSGVRRLQRTVRKLVRNQEIRYIDTGETPVANLGTTGTFYLLNPSAAGDNDGNFEGSKYVMKSLQLSYTFINEDQGSTGNWFRCMLIYDKQANKATPSTMNVLATASPDANPIRAFKNWGNRFRFKVLYDRTHTTDSDDLLGLPGYGEYKMFKRFFLPTYTDGQNSGIAGINKGALYLWFASNSNTTPHPAAIFNARLRYVA